MRLTILGSGTSIPHPRRSSSSYWLETAGGTMLLEQPFPVEVFEVIELEPFEVLTGFEAVTMKTPHTDESHAIHLRDESGKTLVYSADTGFAETFEAFANKVNLFILECSYPKDKPVKKHLELAEAMYLVRKAKPERAVLTHFYPEWDGADFDAEVAKFSPFCEVIQAADGLRLKI